MRNEEGAVIRIGRTVAGAIAGLLVVASAHADIMFGAAGKAELASLKGVYNDEQLKRLETASLLVTADRLCGETHVDPERAFRIVASIAKTNGIPENVFMRHVVKIADLNVREIGSDTRRIIEECELLKKHVGPRED
ncbi:hypothetical protein ACFFJB_01310 [Camelimonas abortus]|uniref:Co-chaperone DjlA N-terminal domain-containing protein n=1 Tax=Camelimonas abortus TaxID=1017184 RepID=A0ABV7LG19_9HYPH